MPGRCHDRHVLAASHKKVTGRCAYKQVQDRTGQGLRATIKYRQHSLSYCTQHIRLCVRLHLCCCCLAA